MHFSLDYLHSSGTFLDILEKHYFGSHVNTPKLVKLLEHISDLGDYNLILQKLKRKMVLYKSKTGLPPFPNAKYLVAEIKTYFDQEEYEKGVIFYLLAEFSNEPAFSIFKENPSLLPLLTFDHQLSDIIHGGLLSLNKEEFLGSEIDEEARTDILEDDEDPEFQQEDLYLSAYSEVQEKRKCKENMEKKLTKFKDRKTHRTDIDKEF